MSTDKYRWMRWLPDPLKREDYHMKNRGVGDDIYEISIHPLTLAVNGSAWSFVSNGAASLMIRGHVEHWKMPSESQAAMIRRLVTTEIGGKLYPISDFKRWLGKGWRSALPCSDCGSNWAKNCRHCFGIGRHQVRCEGCDDVHDCACSKCVKGTVFCPSCVGENGPDRRPGSYQEIVFDRALLARFMAHVEAAPDARVRVMTDGKTNPIWVEHWDQSWRIAIGPMRDQDLGRVPSW